MTGSRTPFDRPVRLGHRLAGHHVPDRGIQQIAGTGTLLPGVEASKAPR
jgi:hypothetical protein